MMLGKTKYSLRSPCGNTLYSRYYFNKVYTLLSYIYYGVTCQRYILQVYIYIAIASYINHLECIYNHILNNLIYCIK